MSSVVTEVIGHLDLEVKVREAMQAFESVGGVPNIHGVTAPSNPSQGYYAGMAVAYDYILYRMGGKSVLGIDHAANDVEVLRYL